MDNKSGNARPAFYTVTETARILRVGASTLYRAIREKPSRPSASAPATSCRRRPWTSWPPRPPRLGGCVDVARMASERRTAREVARLTGGASW